MRKYFFLLVVFFLVDQLHAQKTIGTMAGSGFSNRIDRNVSELTASILPTDSKTICSFFIGGYKDFLLSDLVSLSPELFYTRRGRKMYFAPLQMSVTFINNSSINPPIFMKSVYKLDFYVSL